MTGLLTEVLKDVPHRQWVFSIPSASIAVQTYGDFLNFNPCMLSPLMAVLLMMAVSRRHQVLYWRIWKRFSNMRCWNRITPLDKNGLGNLASYIIRACFSPERMVYVPVGRLSRWYCQSCLHIQRREVQESFYSTGLVGQTDDSYSRAVWTDGQRIPVFESWYWFFSIWLEGLLLWAIFKIRFILNIFQNFVINLETFPSCFFDLDFCLDINWPPLIRAQHVVLVSEAQYYF